MGSQGSLELGSHPIHHHVGTVMDSIVWHPELCWLRNRIGQVSPIQHIAMDLGVEERVNEMYCETRKDTVGKMQNE